MLLKDCEQIVSGIFTLINGKYHSFFARVGFNEVGQLKF